MKVLKGRRTVTISEKVNKASGQEQVNVGTRKERVENVVQDAMIRLALLKLLNQTPCLVFGVCVSCACVWRI